MKKIIALLISAGIFTASYAQEHNNHEYGRNDQYTATSHGRYYNDDHDRDHRYNDHYKSYAFQKQIQIDRINREYYYRVMSIQHNRYLTHRQKKLAIRDAKKERSYQILMMNRNMNGYANNGYGKHYDGDRR